tara:strand:- start:925 stop:1113 length:189 start_codon:yes stop_codon:yes gene_type:complete
LLPHDDLISIRAFSENIELLGQKARTAPRTKVYLDRAAAAVVNDNSVAGFVLFNQGIGTIVS